MDKEPGVLSRLLGFVRRLGFEHLDVRVLPFSGEEAKPEHSRRVVKALGRLPGTRARPLQRTLDYYTAWDEAESLVAAEMTCRRCLAGTGGDLIILGEVPFPGTHMYLRFVSALPPFPEQMGAFGATTLLVLPTDFGPEFAPLLSIATLAAIVPRSATKARLRYNQLQRLLNRAQPVIEGLPKSLSPIERGTIRACFADAAAQMAQLQRSAVMREIAVLSYTAALKAIPGDEWPLVAANVHKNRGLVLLMEGGSANRLKRLDDGIDALRQSLKVLNRERFPKAWGIAQARIGEALYRLEAEGGDMQLLRQAVAADQAALQVFNRKDEPLLWASVMHNLARAAQVLGEELKNTEVLEKAVEACKAVLEVHTRSVAPHQWASTQNDLGSALFLLGRQSGDDAILEAAAKAFEQAKFFYQGSGVEGAVAVAIVDRNLARVEALRKRLSRRPAKPTHLELGRDADTSAEGKGDAKTELKVVTDPLARQTRTRGSPNSRRRRSGT